MLFGRSEYMPEGAGVDPDAPRKKGVARLVEILSRDLDSIFLSGVLAMLACAPAAILAGIALWLGSYFWMQNALFDAPISKKLSNCVQMLLGFLPRTALSAAFQLEYWLLMAVVIPRCAFIFLLTGLWLPNLLAMMAT